MEEVERWTKHWSLLMTLSCWFTNPVVAPPLVKWKMHFPYCLSQLEWACCYLQPKSIINDAGDSEVLFPRKMLILTWGKENLGSCPGCYSILLRLKYGPNGHPFTSKQGRVSISHPSAKIHAFYEYFPHFSFLLPKIWRTQKEFTDFILAIQVNRSEIGPELLIKCEIFFVKS